MLLPERRFRPDDPNFPPSIFIFFNLTGLACINSSFGCLIASPIPFNLYGGIIVVCMGLALFMLSYVSLISPLDDLILNYEKLDQWREQRHFRVQLETQRINEDDPCTPSEFYDGPCSYAYGESEANPCIFGY